jgi:hypothetical protein
MSITNYELHDSSFEEIRLNLEKNEITLVISLMEGEDRFGNEIKIATKRSFVFTSCQDLTLLGKLEYFDLVYGELIDASILEANFSHENGKFKAHFKTAVHVFSTKQYDYFELAYSYAHESSCEI